MSGVRGRGVTYDTGARPAGRTTRPSFDPATVREDMRVVARDLHCTAVRITGDDPGRLTVAAEHAADAGLEVWFSPFPCEMTEAQMLPYLVHCAARAEDLRGRGAEVVLVTGGELGIFARGFLPGDDLFARLAGFAAPRPQLRETLAAVPPQLNAFLNRAVAAVRGRFGGRITYAAAPFEQVDWTSFDIVGVDAYRDAQNAAGYRDGIRGHGRHGKPVAVTEFGCCTYRGAADRGGRGWMVVDRTALPPRLDGAYVRDEEGQAAHLTDVLRILGEEGVDSAFWFTFAGYAYPHDPDPRHDLDLASYGLVRVDADGRSVPKAAFHAMAAAYRE
ncbi:hypothetical protein ACQPZA_13645 [Pseudonocardia xinjiangensis]|uniref:hypothetical protein n=1 Tax=Pseudonocardia xinjiangensis TaxID=75289 RepID=UPI003D8AEC46